MRWPRKYIIKNNFDFSYLSKFSEIYRLENFSMPLISMSALDRDLDKHEIIYIRNKASYIQKKFEAGVVQ